MEALWEIRFEFASRARQRTFFLLLRMCYTSQQGLLERKRERDRNPEERCNVTVEGNVEGHTPVIAFLR